MFENLITFVGNVLFIDPAGIPRTSGSLTVDSGQNAVLECEVDANPIDENTVKWSRANFDMSRTTTTLDQTVTARNRAVSKLTVNGVTKTDAGQFYCEASNGLGSAITSVVELLIKCTYSSTYFLSLVIEYALKSEQKSVSLIEMVL